MNTPTVNSLPGTQALILAGGRGERLSPLTATRPKPAIPFGGCFRIVDFTLSNCLDSNVGHVALLTQYLHEELHRYIRRRWSESWNAPAPGSRQLICLPPASGKHYRGTADAVFQNLHVVHSNCPEHVLVLSGDHVYTMDYRELLSHHVETNADVTIAAVEHPLRDATHFGVVEVDNSFRVTGFQEKPRNPRPLPSRPDMALISMGVYVFKTDVLIRSVTENCERASGYDFGHHVIPALIDSARVFAFDFKDEAENSPRYWRDIGTLDSYYQASMDVVRRGASLRAPLKHAGHARAAAPSEITASVSGGAYVSGSMLSAGVRVEPGASVEDSVLMPGVRVGQGARIRRAIVEEGVQIPANWQVGWNIEHDRTRHAISPSGVVVVSQTPSVTRPVALGPYREKFSAGWKPAKVRKHVSSVA